MIKINDFGELVQLQEQYAHWSSPILIRKIQEKISETGLNWTSVQCSVHCVLQIANCFFFRYEGLIRNNRMHGRGSYHWPNGDNYLGEYHNGLRNGYGEMIYQSKNEKYAGRWQDGLYHGQGQYW